MTTPRRDFLSRTFQILLVAAVGAVVPTQPARGFTLVEDRDPKATIVLAEKPTGSAQLAAYELQYHIRKISGATLPMVREPADITGNRILVGESKAALELGSANREFQEQEYTIKTFPGALLLMGHDGQEFSVIRYEDYTSLYQTALGPIGTCYAVHAFLENSLGVRWYYPNEAIGEVIPAAATVTIGDLDVRRSPDAPVRSIYPLFSNTGQLFFTEWDEPEKFQSAWVDSRLSLLYWIRHRFWGGMRYNANHSFHGYDVAFGQSHPEWFSTKNYERMKQLPYQNQVQPCLTSPGFLEQVVEIARDYFDGKPAAHPGTYRANVGNFFPVVPNDNTNMCGCPECRIQYRNDVGLGGDASHYVWGFVNRVAGEVRKTHPQAMVSGLAYFNYTLPPRGMVFEPNVAVTFCKFYTRYHDRKYQERDYRRIAEYVRDNKARFFTTYEYPCHPFMGQWPFPCMLPHVQSDDVKRLGSMTGFMGGNMDRTANFSHPGGGLAWSSPVLDFMNVYWRVKLYDDFNLDIDKALDEYYETFFGPGAAGMKMFYTAMEDRWMTLGGGAESRSWWGKLGTPAFLKEVAGHIRQARQATAEGSVFRRRVELIDAGILQYLLKARARYEGSAMSEFAPIGHAAVADTVVPAGSDWADDATWANALPNQIEKTHLNDPVPQKTVFTLAYDDRNLYLKARCLESHVSQMKAATQARDIGGFSDDSIELFVDPTGRGETYYQFCINSLGAVYDAREDPAAIGATATITWNSGIEVKTSVGEKVWELRAALPFASFVTETPGTGSTWRFNLCRNRFAEHELPPYSAWSPTLGSFRNPERFGIITFNAPEDQGRTLWNCDFEGGAFASASGESPLIGLDGWYENTSYANRGWDVSWKVVEQSGNRLATGDINATNPSDMVPVHTVHGRPGTLSVEAMFRRHTLSGNMPALQVYDLERRTMAYLFAWIDRGDLVGIEQHPTRHNFGDDVHGLGDLAAVGKWFGLKVVIDTEQKGLTGYVKSDGNQWVRLNQAPIPYLDPEASGSTLCVSVGSRRHDTVEGNILDMDNIRVTQLALEKKLAAKFTR